MALEGTIKTPLGTVQKKTALIVGGGVAIFGVIIWYRQKQLGGTSDTTTTDAQIDPATGYAYGSPEDAAALAQQASYVSPGGNTGGGGGGSSTIPQSNVGYTSNGQWTQAVIATLSNSGAISDPTALSAALGKYITGAYVAPASTDENLIQQAIAVEGYPPVSGASGYPPSINRTPPTPATNSPPTQSNITNISGLKVTGSTNNSLTFGWAWGAVKPDYVLVYKDNVPFGNIGNVTSFTMHGLKSKTTYKFTVRGVKGTTIGPSYAVSGKTK